MANQPTIVVANLDDAKLKASIDKMVNDLNAGLNRMTTSTDAAVRKMQASLQSLGDIKFSSGGSDGGSTRRTTKQQEEADIVTKTARAYDQLSASMQKTASSSKNESPTQTMQTQLELMIERLRSARSQYSSFVELAAHATTTGDKGLFQFATENVHRYEQEVHDLIPQIRNMRDAISQMGNVLAPQGHAIENFAKSLQQTNPELALLNQQYKRGVALLQQQNIGLKRTADEERTIAEESRNRLQKESQYVAAASQREKQRREDITQSAQAARELSRELIKGLSSGNIEINYQNYAKLKEYFEQMRQVYHNFMTEEEKESPVGKALKNDINVVGAAIRVLKEYSSAFNRFQHEAPKPSGIGNNQSLDSLKNAIKNLSDVYSRMTVEEMRAGKDTKIIEKFQRLSREAQVLQRRLSTPVSLSSAMKLPEKTLDEIAYKMQMLASYRLNLNIFDPKEKAEIDAVNKALDRLGKEQNKILGNNKEMLASNNALIRSFNYMKNRLAFYFTVGASTQFVKSLIDIRSQYEMNERALGILINSAERGTQIFKELSEMALVSPYTLIELSSAAKQLVAYDIAAKDVVDTTRRLADMASAVGVPMERLTYALGQIKAYGYLNSRDARMFANAGIPLVKQLADYYTQLEGRIISVGDVYDRMKKKAIDYNDVMAVVTRMTDEGGKFFDFQAKMADSLKVRLANLTLAWNNMMNEIGESRQGMLTATIGGLKELFLHWKEISNVINGLLLAFGMFKLAQITALAFMGELNTAMGWQVILGTKLQQKLASLATGYKTMSMGITAAGAAFWIIAADAIMTYNKNVEEIERLNSTIQNGAAEASEALEKLLHSSEMVSAKLAAVNNKLSVNEASKTWEVLREQIEMSAASSKAIIAELIREEDLNIRVSKAFTLAESIQKATSSLSELNNELDITQDSILYGAFGEGLVEDIEDYNEHLKHQAELSEWAAKKNKGFFENAIMGIKTLVDSFKEDMGSSSEEAENEIKNFARNAAETIREELGEEGLKDDIQVNEAVARVLSGIEQMFPQIRGKGKALFEEFFYDTMSKEFPDAVDKQEFYYDKFLERLKKDYASAFSDVTDEIRKKTHTWSTAQTDAIQKTADKLRKDLPEASQSAIDEILRQLNTTEFKVRIIAEMATTSLDNIQKSFKDKFITKDSFGNELSEKQRLENQQKYGALMRKNGEDNIEYEKRISEEKEKQQKIIDKNEEIIKKNANAQVVADAKVAKSNAEAFIAAAKDVEKWGGYDFSSKKENANAKKAAKQAESELQKALKDELSTIDKVRSIYKDLTKEGMSHADAVERATRGWDETVNAINRVLQKNGLQKLDLSKFAGIENPRELVNMLQSQLNTLLKRGAKPAEIKELQTKIKTLWVDVDKYDLTMITKGLNNELGKLKDEYELAVELDANPELGGMFLDMFGIDPSDFSHSIDDYMFKVQSAFEKARRELGYGVTIDVFKANDEEWREWGKWVGLSGEALDNFKARFVGARDVAKKWAQDVVKQTQDLQYKLADNNGKIAIEEEKLANLRVRLANEVNDEQKRLLELQIQDQQNAIAKLKEEILQLLPTYQRVFGEVAEHSAYMTRKLAKDYKNMLVEGKNRGLNADNTYSVRDPITGQIARISKDRMGKELKNADKELQKTQSTVKKITEAFTKGEDGVVDWVHGVELVGEELGKLGQFVDVVGNIVDAFGNPNEYNATAEAIHDIATSLQGVATAAQGIGQIASGDYIGGAVSVASGLFSAISSWFDNADKEILQQIKDSELAVKRLENAYKNLEFAIENAYGANVIGAKQAAIANKELQLAELQRQLALEKSRDSKHRDEERIETLKGEIIDLRNEIKTSYQEVATSLLGISSVGDAALEFMDTYIEALRKGEDAQAAFTGSYKEMIASMIKQLWVTKVIGPQLEAIVDELNNRLKNRSKTEAKAYEEASRKYTEMSNMSDEEVVNQYLDSKGYNGIERLNKFYSLVVSGQLSSFADALREQAEKEMIAAKKELNKATIPTIEDMDLVVQGYEDIKPALEATNAQLEELLKRYDLYDLGDASKNLSALQQGIQGVTEETAGALEAITNGISQQSYLQSDLLTQIRDVILGFDIDIQTATLGQILLQLQNSYQVQMSIQNMLEGALNPSGRAFMVELNS